MRPALSVCLMAMFVKAAACGSLVSTLPESAESPEAPAAALGGGDGGEEGDGGAAARQCRPGTIVERIVLAEPAAPRSLVFDLTGRLYALVSDGAGAGAVTRVRVFSGRAPMTLVAVLGEGRLFNARDLAVSSDDELVVLSVSGGPGERRTFVTTFSAAGVERSQREVLVGRVESLATSFAIEPGGGYFVALTDYQYVRLSRDGATTSEGAWRIVLPHTVRVSSSGELLVTDILWNLIRRFGPDLTQRAVLGGRGSGPGLFDGAAPSGDVYGPTALAVDHAGSVYAGDPSASRVQRFGPLGEYEGELGFEGSREIGPLAVDAVSGLVAIARPGAIDLRCPP